MINRTISLTIPVLVILFSCVSTPLDKRLKKHVYFLASDNLHGRETGTEYEKLAAAYIEEEFKKIGLEPMGENGTFYQDYAFLAGKTPGNTNRLTIDGVELEMDKDYFPLNFSLNGEAEGKLIDMGTATYIDQYSLSDQRPVITDKNGVFLININNRDPENSVGPWKLRDLHILAGMAEEHGAAAVLFFSCDTTLIDVKGNFSESIPSVSIPVMFLFKCDVIDPESNQEIILKVENKEDRRKGRNVIGFIDNGAENTVIIGGHHDHLGHGNQSKPFDVEDTNSIFNGADDGASGIALIIEFARWVKNSDLSKHNYLFISFSGEEIGLLGSMYFTENPTIELSKVSCMISFDHIGRMDPIENNIILYGTGTSPGWNKILDSMNLNGESMVRYETGVGLTDYTSFYIKNVPVLGFCTDVHDDFHAVSDEADRINYEGMVRIFDLVKQVCSTLTNEDKLEFTNTTDPHELLKFILRHADYSFEGNLGQ